MLSALARLFGTVMLGSLRVVREFRALSAEIRRDEDGARQAHRDNRLGRVSPETDQDPRRPSC